MNRRLIVNWSLEKWDTKPWTRSFWLRFVTVNEFLWGQQWNFGLQKKTENFFNRWNIWMSNDMFNIRKTEIPCYIFIWKISFLKIFSAVVGCSAVMKSSRMHRPLDVVSVRETTDVLVREMPWEKTQLTDEGKLNGKVSHFTCVNTSATTAQQTT